MFCMLSPAGSRYTIAVLFFCIHAVKAGNARLARVFAPIDNRARVSAWWRALDNVIRFPGNFGPLVGRLGQRDNAANEDEAGSNYESLGHCCWGCWRRTGFCPQSTDRSRIV